MLEVQRVAVDDDLRHHAPVEIAQQVRERNLGDGDRLAGAQQEGAGHDRKGGDRGGDPDASAGPLASRHVTLRFVQGLAPAGPGTSAQRTPSFSVVSRNFRLGRGNVCKSYHMYRLLRSAI